MPWNNQTGGGWKGGGNGGGPWGQGPRGPGQTPPDLEALLRRGQDRLKRVLPGGGGGINPLFVVLLVLIAAAIIGLFFFTFRVEANQLGVVLRFGKVERTVGPGFNFRLPFPIETVYTPQVLRSNAITVGRTQDDRGGLGRDVVGESLMLTGDENIIDIDFSVFWEIKDAQAYLFNLRNPESTVKAVAESAMREVVGRSDIQPLLTDGRPAAERNVLALMQKTLDKYQSGILIDQVQILKSDPPAEVIASFRDVQAARADQERAQNEAQSYANRVVPEARGRASQVTEGANAYRDQVTAEAQGKADRFSKVYAQYRLAPDVTRRRIYLETMEQIFATTDKVIIDQNTGQGVVPYLPLSELGKPLSAPAPAAQAAPRPGPTGLIIGPTGARP